MSKFKVGDVVRCVKWAGGDIDSVTKGALYQVASLGGNVSIYLEGKIGPWTTDLFELTDLVEDKPQQPQGKITSEGGSSQYYDFPSNCVTLNDLIEYKEMSFAHGNIFKAAYRLGHKEGITLEYDLNKIIYYANRMLDKLKPKEGGAASAAKKGK